MFELDAYTVRPDASPRDVYHIRKERAGTFVWAVKDGTQAVDLAERIADTSQTSAKLLLREWRESPVKEEWNGTLLSAEAGTFEISYPESTIGPGVFLCHLVVYSEPDVIELVDEGYVDLRGDVRIGGPRPLSIVDVRMALYDLDPELNRLIDRLEFEDGAIAYCMQRPIDLFNETPPDLGVRTPKTFPWREHWLQGTCAYLLRQISHLMSRTNLTYQAGGMSINDMDKAKEYRAVAEQLLGEYKNWLVRKKVELNCNQFYGFTGSGFDVDTVG